MAANDTRPVHLDMTKISLPIMGVASIMHRVCAVISWVGLGIGLFTLITLQGKEDGLLAMNHLIAENFFAQFVYWGILSAFGYYCAGTIKHLIQDLGFFEDLSGGKMISCVALCTGLALAIAAGVMIWA